MNISSGHSHDRVRHFDRHGSLRDWFCVVVGHRAKEKAKEKSDSAKGYRAIARMPNVTVLSEDHFIFDRVERSGDQGRENCSLSTAPHVAVDLRAPVHPGPGRQCVGSLKAASAQGQSKSSTNYTFWKLARSPTCTCGWARGRRGHVIHGHPWGGKTPPRYVGIENAWDSGSSHCPTLLPRVLTISLAVVLILPVRRNGRAVTVGNVRFCDRAPKNGRWSGALIPGRGHHRLE